MKNLNDIKKRFDDWCDTMKLFVKSIRMSDEMKCEMFIQAKEQSEEFLTKNRLNVPFHARLEKFEIIKFITQRKSQRRPFGLAATYDIDSCMMGTIQISIMSHLIGDANKNIHNFLHEYSHAIYEEGMLNYNTINEILKLRKYHNIYFANRYDDYDKEQFCDFFSLFLRDEISSFSAEETENINDICNEIITQFTSLYWKKRDLQMKYIKQKN